MSRIAIVVSSPLTVRAFLSAHIRALAETHSVTVILDKPTHELTGAFPPEVRWVPVPIRREIAPWHDLVALAVLCRALALGRFDMVLSVTPKAGLLTAISSRLVAVPIRLHFFTGQVWVTRRGLVRTILKMADRLISMLSTRTLADSESQRRFLVSEGIIKPDRIDVLGDGSISGVDLDRFRPDPARRQSVRRRLGAGTGDVVYLYLGRLTPDKGVLELARAFGALGPGQRALWFVGPDEMCMRAQLARMSGAGRVEFTGHTEHPEEYLCGADVFCLPSHREGFGTSIIEAAACAVPAVGSRIYGLTDAIEEGTTGLLAAPGNVEELSDCLRRLEQSADLRREMGLAARKRAEQKYDSRRLVRELLAYVDRLLAGHAADG